MKKAIVFGLGRRYNELKKMIPSFYDVEITALTDNDLSKHGAIIDNIEVITPELIKQTDYDVVIVTPDINHNMVCQLQESGIPNEKIQTLPSSLVYFGEIIGKVEFENKEILEIGCGDGNLLKLISDYAKPKFITGFDISVAEETKGVNWCIQHGDAEVMEFDDCSFDTVISIATFEHIQNLQKTLAEIKRVLRPGGIFYTTFSPIWTSVIGHHAVRKDGTYFETAKLIPPWGHLYMSENEMKAHLSSQNVDTALANRIIEYIYYSKNINRISRSDINNSIIGSGMVIQKFEERLAFNRDVWTNPANTQNELAQDVLAKIKKTRYKTSDLSVIGIECKLLKAW